MKKIYLAAPYSAPTAEEREARFVAVNLLAAKLMEAGHVVFSPISHSHPIAHHLGNHLSHEFWLMVHESAKEERDRFKAGIFNVRDYCSNCDTAGISPNARFVIQLCNEALANK